MSLQQLSNLFIIAHTPCRSDICSDAFAIKWLLFLRSLLLVTVVIYILLVRVVFVVVAVDDITSCVVVADDITFAFVFMFFSTDYKFCLSVRIAF